MRAMSDYPTTSATERSGTPPDHVGVLVASLLLIVAGWGGLYAVVTTQIPRVGPRFVFFVCVFLAVAGTLMPVIRYLNVRFTPASRALPPGGVIVRQSAWAGLYAVTCAWLQIPRALSLPIALFLALAIIIIEVFLRSRELSRS